MHNPENWIISKETPKVRELLKLSKNYKHHVTYHLNGAILCCIVLSLNFTLFLEYVSLRVKQSVVMTRVGIKYQLQVYMTSLVIIRNTITDKSYEKRRARWSRSTAMWLHQVNL